MIEFPVNLIQTDFKRIEPGDWFLPMTIKEINQHSFLAEAVKNGIAGFVYEKGQTVPKTNRPHFEVPDLREYLFRLAENRRPLLPTKIAVVAGSAGKTSVKELTGAILRSGVQKNVHVSPENQNTKIALATQILRLPYKSEIAVFEVGARKVGDFKIPLKMIQPEIAALLNTGTAHLGEFGSLENLINEKYSILSASSVKTLIVPSDNPRILKYALETGKRVITFGSSDAADSNHEHVQILHENDVHLKFSISGQISTVHCEFQAPSRALNVAAAIAMATALDIPTDQIQQGIASFSGVARRFQSFDWNGTLAIDDAFNASPESLEAGLRLLKKSYPDQKILLVLGSMLELGSVSTAKHQEAAHLILELFQGPLEVGNVSLVTVGQDAQVIANEVVKHGFPTSAVKSFANALEAKCFVQVLKDTHQAVYFKGSKSMDLHQIFGQP